MTAITTEQLAEWRALADAATEGPWTNQRMEEGHLVILADDGNDLIAIVEQLPDADEVREVATASLIAAARMAVPALVAEVERLRAALTICRSVAKQHALARTLEGHRIGLGAYADLERIYDTSRAALPEEPADG